MIADEVEVVFRANTNAYIANVTKAEAVFSQKLEGMQAAANDTAASLQPIGKEAQKAMTLASNASVAAAKALKSQTDAALALAKASGTATAEELAAARAAQQQAAASLAVARADRDRAAAANAAAKASNRGFAGVVKDAPRAATAIRGANVQVGNLAAQFQDIGVQLAGGASPFTIISQQVPQIVAATGSVRGAIGGLGAALTQLISPVGLVSTAFILAASVAASYFSDLLSDGEDAEKTLKEQEDLIRRVADRWGEAVPALKEYADQLERANEAGEGRKAAGALIARDFTAANKALDDFITSLGSIEMPADFFATKNAKETGDFIIALAGLKKAYADLRAEQARGGDTADEFAEINRLVGEIQQNKLIPTTGDLRDTVTRLTEAWKAAADAVQGYITTTEGLGVGSGTPPGPPRLILPGDPRYGGDIPTPRLRGVDDFGQSLDDMSKAIDGFVERVVSAESGGRANAKNPLSSATGVGQFIASTWADLFRRYFPAQASTMSRSQILAQRGDPEISRILIRRYAEENAKYLEKAGVTITEAALQLAHFLGPRDAARVYNAAPGTPVQGLIGQAAINANRSILGGGATREDVLAYAERRASGTGSGRTREPKKTPAELFEGDIAQVQKRIDLLNAEIEATAGLSKGVEDYGYAVEKAKIKAELLNEAKAKDLAITPELMERIDQLAGNYAKLSAAKQANIEADRQFKKSQEELARSQEEFANFSKDVLGGFISDLVHGKSAAEALAGALEKIGQKLLDIALDQLFAPTAGGGGGFGGFLASIFGGFKAAGGPVSAGKAYIVGEKRPELFVPNTSGKIIPRVPDMAAMRQGGGSTGGFIRVTTENRVVNGNLVPDMVQVAGLVAGQQVKQSNKTMAARLQQTQARGTS